jgi:hypothetical protein
MSQYIVVDYPTKFMYGWDNPLQSFYLQKHDLTEDEDNTLVVRLGADIKSIMYEVEDLVNTAQRHGLRIPDDIQVNLNYDKTHGK